MYIISQPKVRLLNTLEDLLKSDYKSFVFSVAYAKMSGVNLIGDSLWEFKKKGGTVLGIIGIDQKNTSIEALQELMKICDKSFVFHTEDMSQTFHPKFYFFDDEESKSNLIIGSGNLTNGGLLNNFEMGFGSELKYGDEKERKIIEEVKSIINGYLESGALCKPLDAKLLEQLIEGNYILSEEKQKIKLVEGASREGSEKGERIFGKSEGLLRVHSKKADTSESKAEESTPPYVANTEIEESDEIEDIEEVETELSSGFWKKLSNYDVSDTSSPGQIIIPKGFKDFFPPFINQKVTASGAQQEEAFMNIKFIDEYNHETIVNNARAIFYTPAPNHPRPNSELRFTFLNHQVFAKLTKEDILVFTKSKDPAIQFNVKLIKKGMPEYNNYNGKFDEIG